MSSYTFNGDQSYVYPFVQLTDGSTLTAVPGETYDLDAAPDEHFALAAPLASVPASEPSVLVTDPEPVSAPTDPSPTTPAA